MSTIPRIKVLIIDDDYSLSKKIDELLENCDCKQININFALNYLKVFGINYFLNYDCLFFDGAYHEKDKQGYLTTYILEKMPIEVLAKSRVMIGKDISSIDRFPNIVCDAETKLDSMLAFIGEISKSKGIKLFFKKVFESFEVRSSLLLNSEEILRRAQFLTNYNSRLHLLISDLIRQIDFQTLNSNEQILLDSYSKISEQLANSSQVLKQQIELIEALKKMYVGQKTEISKPKPKRYHLKKMPTREI